MSGAIGSGVALFALGLDLTALKAHAADLGKMDRVKTAKQTTSICCYCSVGCGLICSTDRLTGKIINIEDDRPGSSDQRRRALRQGGGALRPHRRQRKPAEEGPLPGAEKR